MIIGTFNAYRGIVGSIEFNDGKHYGKLLNITDLVNYQADSLVDLEKEFHNAVDDYLVFVEETKKNNFPTLRLKHLSFEEIQKDFEGISLYVKEEEVYCGKIESSLTKANFKKYLDYFVVDSKKYFEIIILYLKK